MGGHGQHLQFHILMILYFASLNGCIAFILPQLLILYVTLPPKELLFSFAVQVH